MTLILKRADETIPIVFDFSDRLGRLAPGASITSVDAVSVIPTGAAGDLEISDFQDAVIDPVTELAVQVVVAAGIAGTKYRPVCRASVSHSGGLYAFEVQLDVWVV